MSRTFADRLDPHEDGLQALTMLRKILWFFRHPERSFLDIYSRSLLLQEEALRVGQLVTLATGSG